LDHGFGEVSLVFLENPDLFQLLLRKKVLLGQISAVHREGVLRFDRMRGNAEVFELFVNLLLEKGDVLLAAAHQIVGVLLLTEVLGLVFEVFVVKDLFG